jgi:carbon-monoxide dehydrogenase medium subunit
MKLRLATPAVLVDVGRLRDLSYVRDADDHIAIGPLTRHRDLEVSAVLAEHCPVVSAVAAQVGDPQVRHRGTIGGSVAHGDPASDLAALLVALEAVFVVRGPNGSRDVAASDFFRGFLETALATDELLTEIRVPKTTGATFSYQKINRRAMDWAIVGAVVLSGVEAGASPWRVGLVNMGMVPVRATAVEAALAAGATAGDAAALATEGTDPPGDPNASREYREHLARVLVRRGLEEVAA